MLSRNIAHLLLIALVCWLAPLLPGQAFSVSTGTTALTIHPGDSNVALPVMLGSGDGSYTGPVTVTLTGLPSGITVTPLLLSPGASGTLLLTASVAADQEAFPAVNPADPNAATSTATVLAFAGAQQASTTFALTVSLSNPTFAPQPSAINLPIVQINTSGVAIADKDTNVPGTITITSADGHTAYLPGTAGSDATATFHVHGNSTSVMPKKPYDVKLNTSADLLSVMGLQCGYVTSANKPTCDKSKSFILLANYDDKTLLRDWAASALANAIPIGGQYLGESAASPSPSGTSTLMPWAPHSLFVELYVNGQYEGDYQLIEQIKVDSHRLNITEMSSTNLSGSALTGGYLLEVDRHQTEDYTWISPKGMYLGLIDPDFTPEMSEQTSYITNYVNAAETALFSDTYTDPARGWQAYFDKASAVNFYLVNDLLGNVDGGSFYSSVFLYKDRSNPLLYMGPIWDFDISSGNVNYASILDPSAPYMQQQVWYRQLFSDPVFQAAARSQWNALKDNHVLSNWLNAVSAQAVALQQTQQNNFGRWPMQGIRVWPNAEANGSYNGEVSYFLNWVRLRMGYLDATLNQLPASSISLSTPSGTLRTGTPVTLTAVVTGDHPTGTVTFSYNSIVIGSASLDANGTASLTSNTIAPGTWYLEAYYDGDSGNAMTGTLGPQVTVLAPLVQTTASLAAPRNFAYGSPTALTVAVQGVSGTAAPTGAVTFTSDGSSLGSSPLQSNGLATLQVSTLPPGSHTLQAAYSGDLTYTASVTNSLSITGSQGTATLALSGMNTTYTGGSQPVTVSTQPAGLSYTVTYDGSSTAPTIPGTYTVVATVTDPDYSGSATGTLTIGKANATITLGGLAATYTGSPQSVSAITQPAGLSSTTTYNGAASPPSVAGSYAVVTTVNDPNYTGTASGTLVIGKASATVSLPAAIVSYTGSPQAVAATVQPATLAYTVSYNGAPAPPTDAGTYTVVATVSDPNYSGSATGTLLIQRAAATITLAGSSSTYNGNPQTLSAATQPAGLSYTLTYNGAAAAPVAAGTYTAVATIADPNYTGSTSMVFSIAKAAAAVDWTVPAAITFGTPLSATQLNASTAVPGSLRYSPAAGALLNAGTAALAATFTPTDSANYTEVTRSVQLVVNKQLSTTTLVAGATSTVPGQTVALTATVAGVTSGTPTGTVTFFDGASPLATQAVVNGTTTYATSGLLSGAHSLTAVYSGDENYAASPGSTASSLSVAPLDFSFSTTATAMVMPQGGLSTSLAYALAPTYGVYPGSVTLEVTGLPASMQYNFSQNNLATSAGPATVMLTISSAHTVASAQRSARMAGICIATLFMVTPLAGRRRRSQLSRRLLIVVLAATGCAAATSLAGCGAQAASAQTYHLVVSATSGAMQHTLPVDFTTYQ